MIVISGALVLVALALLIAGLIIAGGLTLVYVSIGVSVVSGLFLVIGVLQRRGEVAPRSQPMRPTPSGSAATGAPRTFGRGIDVDQVDAARSAYPTAEPVRSSGRAPVRAPAEPERSPSRAGRAPAEPASAVETLDPDDGRFVYVVEGRPRYHTSTCRYLADKDVDEIDVDDAREEGFTPCGVCKPDLSLAPLPGADDELADDELADDELADEDDGGFEDELADDELADEEEVALAPEPVVAQRPRTARRPATTRAAAREPVLETSAASRSRRSAAKSTAVRERAVVAEPVAVPEPIAVPEAIAVPERATVARGRVLVIPDRGKFHQPNCRYVRGNDEAVELTKAVARRQGYEPCGVCRP